MTSKVNRIGIIQINPSLILQWLQYDDAGELRNIRLNPLQNVIEITIEHPSMPIVGEGYRIPLVRPAYTTYQDSIGHRVTLRVRNEEGW